MLYYLKKGSGNITYSYDATGAKQKKIVSDVSSLTTEYAGNYVYENGQLKFFNHSEGYVERESDGSFTYIYQYKDHLGNNRLNYADKDGDGRIDVLKNNIDVDGDGDYAREILQENNYYPFGLQHKGYNTQITGQEHNYKYNGTELTEELGLNWYEMPLRSYDPAIARWNRIDPVVHHGLSPYNAFDNNPVFYSDPSGGNSEWGVSGGRHFGGSDFFAGVDYDRAVSFAGSGNLGTSFGTNFIGAIESLGTPIDWKISYPNRDSNKTSKVITGDLRMTFECPDCPSGKHANGTEWIGPDGGTYYYDEFMGGWSSSPAVNFTIKKNQPKAPEGEFQANVAIALTISNSDGGMPTYMKAIGLGVGLGLTAETAYHSIQDALTPDYTITTEATNSFYITLYRGVHFGHPDYASASMGMAVPWALGPVGHNDQGSHTNGNYKSIFTSWTFARSVADFHANKASAVGPGLVLMKRFRLNQVVPAVGGYNGFDEGEFLVPGVVRGASVMRPIGAGAPYITPRGL